MGQHPTDLGTCAGVPRLFVSAVRELAVTVAVVIEVAGERL